MEFDHGQQNMRSEEISSLAEEILRYGREMGLP